MSEEPEVRIAAMKKLRNVALAIGKARTKSELVTQLSSESSSAARDTECELTYISDICIGCARLRCARIGIEVQGPSCSGSSQSQMCSCRFLPDYAMFGTPILPPAQLCM